MRPSRAVSRWSNGRARFEVVRLAPPVIFDSAHNQDLFAGLRQTLDENFPDLPVYLIFGASEDKNIPGMFEEMKPRIKWLIITRADHPRALEVEKIQSIGRAGRAAARNGDSRRGRLGACVGVIRKRW